MENLYLFIVAITIAVLVWRIMVLISKLVVFHALAIAKEDAKVSFGWDWTIIFLSTLIVAIYFIF